jgi:hypothetical protein
MRGTLAKPLFSVNREWQTGYFQNESKFPAHWQKSNAPGPTVEGFQRPSTIASTMIFKRHTTTPKPNGINQ